LFTLAATTLRNLTTIQVLWLVINALGWGNFLALKI